ncbi:transporter substrate-binding domain-containing protein [Hahella sp. KA22]|uniref:substrate-binding periplasmic protein n=1 Tax=Hahella sp. KA22 TaxID=1628392 RepID=UPI000FDDDE45|nr:transporter substrate-binding domain-containing protein [Hahella sp. KA22]AZZ92448.1 transporter substrate-binding domain-containing protein [Hahella sp. KA22]QAY55822.1 transporter substrate-binding domain-containing protein [Hahella sp. KA22]
MVWLRRMFFSCILISIMATLHARAEDKVWLSIGEFPPFFSSTLSHYGVFPHIVEEAFAAEHIKVEYVFLPWNRALRMAAEGDYDGTPGWVYSKERAQQFSYSDPVLIETKVFFHLKSLNFDWSSIEDLKPYKIGLTLGYFYGPTLARAEVRDGFVFERVSTDLLNMRKLAAGRIQLFAVNREVGLQIARSEISAQDAANITYHPKPISVDAQHLLISRNIDPVRARFLLDSFNRGLRKLRDSGRYETLWKEDIGVPFTPPPNP